jgi:hypothetical protein
VARYKGIDVISVDLNKEAVRDSHEVSKRIHKRVEPRMHCVIADGQNLRFRDVSILQVCCISFLNNPSWRKRFS